MKNPYHFQKNPIEIDKTALEIVYNKPEDDKIYKHQFESSTPIVELISPHKHKPDYLMIPCKIKDDMIHDFKINELESEKIFDAEYPEDDYEDLEDEEIESNPKEGNIMKQLPKKQEWEVIAMHGGKPAGYVGTYPTKEKARQIANTRPYNCRIKRVRSNPPKGNIMKKRVTSAVIGKKLSLNELAKMLQTKYTAKHLRKISLPKCRSIIRAKAKETGDNESAFKKLARGI